MGGLPKAQLRYTAHQKAINMTNVTWYCSGTKAKLISCPAGHRI